MAHYVLYCSQDAAPTVSTSGTLQCDGGIASIQVGSLDTLASAPDMETVGEVWAAAFSLVLLCYMLSKAVGTVLEMIRES